MKPVFKIGLLLLFSFQLQAQELFYQNTFKGGVSFDGVTYSDYGWLNSDIIHFQNSVPAGCTLKKAFLISYKISCASGSNDYPPFDIPVLFNYNGHSIQFDTSDNVTPLFYSSPVSPYGQSWMCVKEVTLLTLNANNTLITPCQSCNINFCNYYEYFGFYLLLLYENNTYSNVNVAFYLNNTTYTPVMNYTLNT